MISGVIVPEDIMKGIVEYAREGYPNEILLLLRGKIKDGLACVESVVIPPFAKGGRQRAYFNPAALPAGMGIIGSVHSHPSGVAIPSAEDLLYGYGPIIMIVGYPATVRAFDKNGMELRVMVKDRCEP